MKKEGIHLNAGTIVGLTKFDHKVVDKALAELKTDELIASPKMCYWKAK